MPTIVTSVPRAAFTDVTAQAASATCRIPVVASNRINMPEVAEEILAERRRRPRLDGAAVPRRPRLGRARPRPAAPTRSTPASPATRPASTTPSSSKHVVAACVNPRAARETELVLAPTRRARSASPSSAPDRPGSSAATDARRARPPRRRCSRPRDDIGGQFGIARRIPGKEEFAETHPLLHAAGSSSPASRCTSARRVDAADCSTPASTRSSSPPASRPRIPTIPGIDHPKVLSYADVVRDGTPVRRTVAVIGAGGIGVDVSEFLTHDALADPRPRREWKREWGVTDPSARPVGCRAAARAVAARGVPAAAQARTDRQAGWARPPAGCTGPR